MNDFSSISKDFKRIHSSIISILEQLKSAGLYLHLFAILMFANVFLKRTSLGFSRNHL
jgi:hypothetical protein